MPGPIQRSIALTLRSRMQQDASGQLITQEKGKKKVQFRGPASEESRTNPAA